MKPNFPQHLNHPLLNLKTNTTYRLIKASDLHPTKSQLQSIVDACSTGPVYEWLFKDIFPQGYSLNEAVSYVARSHKGWCDLSYFVFFVLDTLGNVTAALDIKTADLEAGEIGYWVHPAHSGLARPMVTAMKDVAKSAGFKKLFAQIKAGNGRSEKVLLANAFVEAPEYQKNSKCQRAFVVTL